MNYKTKNLKQYSKNMKYLSMENDDRGLFPVCACSRPNQLNMSPLLK